MIRRMKKEDLDKAAEIWLDTNQKAHSFIPAQYWEDHFELVKAQLPQAEVYVYEDEGSRQIQGFVGLNGDFIAGIFVQSQAQSRGIGTMLMSFVKNIRKQLTLNVYQKNAAAVRFYQREAFEIREERNDENTGEQEYTMVWRKQPYESI